MTREPLPDEAAGVATSTDGARIAYGKAGSGPAVMLLHGGGQSRRVWHEAGYVERLSSEFTVLTVDLRGHGESDRPEELEAYAIDRLCGDLLAVADAAGISRWVLWGFSYGANLGRYLASRSDRVRRMIYIGIPFGPAVGGPFRRSILDMEEKWRPILARVRAGGLDPNRLSDDDRAQWETGNLPSMLAWLGAMLDYPAVEPSDLRCPTLWLVGSKNESAMASVRDYEERLKATKVTLHILPGLTHPEELTEIDSVFESAAAFSRVR